MVQSRIWKQPLHYACTSCLCSSMLPLFVSPYVSRYWVALETPTPQIHRSCHHGMKDEPSKTKLKTYTFQTLLNRNKAYTDFEAYKLLRLARTPTSKSRLGILSTLLVTLLQRGTGRRDWGWFCRGMFFFFLKLVKCCHLSLVMEVYREDILFQW